MEHWFDRLTKTLISTPTSRRELLQSAAVAGVSSLLPPSSLMPATWRAPYLDVAADSPCTVKNVGGDTTITYSASSNYGGKVLSVRGVQQRRGVRHPEVWSDIRVDLGGNLVMEMSQIFIPAVDAKGRRTEPVVRSKFTYGKPVNGILRVTAMARGDKVQGFADGREFTLSRTSKEAIKLPSSAPTVRLHPALEKAIQNTFSSAAENIRHCTHLRGNTALQSSPTSRFDLLATSLRQLSPALASRDPLPGAIAQQFPPQGPCDDCLYACDGEFALCVGGVAAGCAVTFGIGCLGIAGCYDSLQSCGNNCNNPGGACCQTACKDYATGCCPSGYTCCGDRCCGGSLPQCTSGPSNSGKYYSCCPSQTTLCTAQGEAQTNFCCANGTTCCGGANCCVAGQTCASQLYGICCPSGQNFCGGACCNGTCLTYTVGSGMNAVQTQTCCAPPNQACGNVCCPPSSMCQTASNGKKVCCSTRLCGDECCTGGTKCYKGKCGFTPPCGGVFCEPLTQICVKGKCVDRTGPTPNPNTICIRGAVACPPPPGGGKSICCAGTQLCCGSICCPNGSICQNANIGQCVWNQ